MIELRDGFLYHPDDGGQLERLLAGERNTAFDDPFRMAILEAEQELRDEEEKERKALERLVVIRAKIIRLKAQKEKIEEAIQHFEEAGEIEDVLIPTCPELIANERCAYADADAPTKVDEIKNAGDELAERLSDDWQIAETKVDDNFVYVTIKRQRTEVAPERPSAEEIAACVTERVKAAFAAYRTGFLDRAQSLRLMAVPANPRASP